MRVEEFAELGLGGLVASWTGEWGNLLGLGWVRWRYLIVVDTKSIYIKQDFQRKLLPLRHILD